MKAPVLHRAATAYGCGPGAGGERANGVVDLHRPLARHPCHQRVLRQRVLRAAEPRGQYVARRTRKGWTDREDEFLRNQWHLLPVEEIARRLGRRAAAVDVRRRRLGIRRYDGDELTLRALRRLTGVDGRWWREAIKRGWLPLRMRVRRVGAKPVGCVTIDGVRSLLKRHPGVLDYRSLHQAARIRLELDSLPDRTQCKTVRCTFVMPAGTMFKKFAGLVVDIAETTGWQVGGTTPDPMGAPGAEETGRASASRRTP